jgi:type IV pilus assembly protein PilB
LLTESVMLEALAASRERRVQTITYIIEHGLADAREVAIAASHEFGAPLLGPGCHPAGPRGGPAGQ